MRKNWKPFWAHARQHDRTNWERGRTIILIGYALAFFRQDKPTVYLPLLGLMLFVFAGWLCHMIPCYLHCRQHGDDDDQGPPEDRFEVIDGRDTFRRFPWLPQ